ncbi:pyroglutamyl-peptidase I [Candidatus Hodarchaeum mangrovi]
MVIILVTGFEPFGEYKTNPSQEIAQNLDKKRINGFKIIGRVIPLRYKEIQSLIHSHIAENDPDIILALGQAPRPSISIERVAINIADVSKIGYNCGSAPKDEKLVEEGPVAYFSTLPIRKIQEYLRKHNIPCYISNSAGTFGCNQIFYYMMNYLEESSRLAKVQAGFIHLPLTPEQVISSPHSANMELQLMKRAIDLIIEYLVQGDKRND